LFGNLIFFACSVPSLGYSFRQRVVVGQQGRDWNKEAILQ
jgi:hypothetical protein